MSSEGLQRLDVWRKAKEYALLVYKRVIPALPAEEKWNLAQQLRRAVASIPANIAEGYGRYYYQENIRFCYIARGSLEESISHILLANELGFIVNDTCKEILGKGNELVRLINGYIAYLKRSRSGEKEPGNLASIHEAPQPYEFTFTEDEELNPPPLSTLDSRLSSSDKKSQE
jgi:four helix bundle protein